jgi:deazaflavin-dependent oxidoreductase (nitroreductase family)
MKRSFYKRSKIGPMTAYRLGLGPLIGRVILLLSTTGRKTGLERVTPLQYELINGDYIIGAALGMKSDWVRNIIADPRVSFRVKNETYTGRAEVITEVGEIVAYIEHRIEQRPIMIRLIMRLDGFKLNPSREELEEYARNLAVVRLVVTEGE